MKRGRPLRSRVEGLRTKLWCLAVHQKAAAKGRSVESALGKDGRWNSLWDRYCRGLVAPSQPRITRIEAVLSGTAQYYTSPIWRSYSPKQWTRLELELAMQQLEPASYQSLRPKFRPSKEAISTEGSPRSSGENKEEGSDPDLPKIRRYAKAVARALKRVSHPVHGMDALSTIFLIVQDLRLMRRNDELRIFFVAWVEAEKLRHQHPLLKYLPIDLFHRPLACEEETMASDMRQHIRTTLGLTSRQPLSAGSIFVYLGRGPSWMQLARSRNLPG